MAIKSSAHIDSSTNQIVVSEINQTSPTVLLKNFSIDFKSTGLSTIYTVPTGYALKINDVFVMYTNVSGLLTPPTVSVGYTGAYNQWAAAVAIPTGSAFQGVSLSVLGGGVMKAIIPEEQTVEFYVSIAATGTSVSGGIIVEGLLVYTG